MSEGLALQGRSGRLITLLAPGDFLAKGNTLMKLTYFPAFWQVAGRIIRKGKVSVMRTHIQAQHSLRKKRLAWAMYRPTS